MSVIPRENSMQIVRLLHLMIRPFRIIHWRLCGLEGLVPRVVRLFLLGLLRRLRWLDVGVMVDGFLLFGVDGCDCGGRRLMRWILFAEGGM